MKLPFPFATIDFEATSLDIGSYPIEVGVAIARTVDAEIETWSTLIRPHRDWDMATAWDHKAERVHGIPQVALRDGMWPAAALDHLNKLLEPIGQVWCDGGQYDYAWLKMLCEAARPTRCAFRIADIGLLFALNKRVANRFADALAESEAPHRAGADAGRICRALISISGGIDHG